MLAKMQSALLKRKNDKGFTLVELLVVVLIIGILSAIVVIAVGNSQKTAKGGACTQDASTIAAAIDHYNLAETTPLSFTGSIGTLTAHSGAALTGWTTATIGTTTTELDGLVAQGYIKTLPDDVTGKNGADVTVVAIQNGTKYAVLCTADGGKDSGI